MSQNGNFGLVQLRRKSKDPEEELTPLDLSSVRKKNETKHHLFLVIVTKKGSTE